METVIEALLRHSRERPAALALADDRRRLTWEEVRSWVDRAAGWLRQRGLPRAAPVLGWLPNSVEWYLFRLSCERAGLFWVPIPASYGAHEFALIAERVRPAVLITPTHFRGHDYSAESSSVCEALELDPIRITLPETGLPSLVGPELDEGEALQLTESAHALATSGSLGVPKLAVYSLAAACERAHSQARLLGLSADDKFLTLSPGVGPVRAAWLAGSVAGASTAALPIFGTDAALAAIGRERPSIVCGTPAQLAMLAPKLEQIDTSAVRIWYGAGSVLPTTLAQDLEERTRGVVISTYGGADFGGWAGPAPEDPPSVRHGTVGRPRGGTQFRIVDAGGCEVPGGKVGELIGRGPCCVSGYLGTQGAEQWRDGWFHTGDLASFDAAGNLMIVGRLKDVINRGGDNVSPAELESLLRTHPAIAQVAVVGVPDPVLGERVCACVVAATDRTVDLELLRSALSAHGLAKYKLPEQLLLLESLPTVGDKIDRGALAGIAFR
jgi:acyl-CoA synthetase (AMP-forming)/AMP-acid ligase II